jgi:N-methylhydantoinase B
MSDPDAATVEVVRNYLTSAAAEMQETLIRTAYSTIIYEILDFGISLYDADLNLIADSPGLSLFLGANDYGIVRAVEHVGRENLEPGDVVLMNYPYWSSTHTLDVMFFAPIFHNDEIVGFATSRAHLLDLGAKDSGYVLDSTDVHQEGLILPGTKLYKAGELDEEILELIRFNSRLPDRVIGDANAEIAAIRTGEKRVQELYEKYSAETVEACIDRILDHGERTATDAIRELPNGTWSAVDYADGSNRDLDDLIRMSVDVTIDDEEFEVDFSDSDDAVVEPLNLPIGMTQTICKLCFKTITTPEEDSNAGQYRPLTVTAPPGNVFHAEYPSPTFTIWTAILGIDVVYKALAKAMPDVVPASSGGDLNAIMLYGTDEKRGTQFLESNNDGVGWGAMNARDGENALMHMSETRVRNIPIEVFENKAPIRFDHLRLRQDSGGVGEYRGGLGIERKYRAVRPFNALSIIQKTKTEGWGLNGGKPGAKNGILLEPDSLEAFDERFEILVDNDDLYPEEDRGKWVGFFRGEFLEDEAFTNASGGGGGYGEPYDRDPEKVREDVVDGYVSHEAARTEYGVVVDEDGTIDWEATERLRSD